MTRTVPHDARSLLTRGMTRFERQLNARLIEALLRDFTAWRRDLPKPPGQDAKGRESTVTSGWPSERRRPENLDARELLDFLILRSRDELVSLQRLVVRHADFSQAISQAVTVPDQQQLVLGYARDLGPPTGHRPVRERKREQRLTEAAVVDRYRRRRGEAEFRLTFNLQRLGRVMEHVISVVTPAHRAAFWERIRLEHLVHCVWAYEGDPRVHTAAVEALSIPLQQVGFPAASGLPASRTIAHLQQTATTETGDVWLQCASLTALTVVGKDRGLPTILARLTDPKNGDDLFVRRHAVRLLHQLLNERRDWQDWPAHILEDPSPFVRQQVAAALWHAPSDPFFADLRRLALNDPSPAVRAATLVTALSELTPSMSQPCLLPLLSEVLERERNDFVLRTAMRVAKRWWELAEQPGPEVSELYRQQILTRLRSLQSHAASTPVRRWACQSAEWIEVQLNGATRTLYERLRKRARCLAPGEGCRLPRVWLRGLQQEQIGRTLAVLAQDDFGYDLEASWFGYRLVKQPAFGFRFWRAWHEFWHPATDKRQAFPHTIGRVSKALIRAPSRILGELSETKVPGEPLYIASDGTWRSFLPLTDDFLSLLSRSLFWARTARFYSSEGVTEVRAPRSLVRCLAAWIRLNLRFSHYAAPRNWDQSPSVSPQKYVQNMRRLGFDVRFRPYRNERDKPVAEDADVQQFFACLVAIFSVPVLPWLGSLLRDYAYYFASAFENSLVHLAWFAAAFLVFFLAKHGYANFRLRRARRAIPLSLGGWGTRGKSGTERLKAALLGTLGHALVSKTTGCEAMFIQAHAFGEPLEIPLFRPYDKATIWEHANLLRFAANLQPSVFLWECMGLTPAYVDVLQRQWTQDDLATITNTYPDHEDLQGPAGFNVASTIAGFIPPESHVITTEEQMRPILQARCERVGTTLRGIGWLEAGLIPEDILARFPYQEHPDNIALVAAVAEELGCPYDVALKGMADRLVPDLGVLKTFPESRIRGRTIEFTNGMSANERFGTLGNWKRTGYDQHDPHEQIGVWVSTVVNNRADRVARSRVFASILVNDLEADRHFLIGGNLKGLLGFIWEAWEAQEETWTLVDAQGNLDPNHALDALLRAARKFRQPSTAHHVQTALRKMLSDIVSHLRRPADALIQESWDNPSLLRTRLTECNVPASRATEITGHQQKLLQSLREYEALASAIRQTGPADRSSLDRQFRKQLRTWFEQKLVIVSNYDATGEEIIRDIVQETPPGYRNRVMGIQNIKGTGLDFIYRFQAWDSCHQACQSLEQSDDLSVRRGLQSLNEMPQFGQLCQERVKQSLQRVRTSPAAANPEIQIQLELIQQKLDESIAENESLLRQDNSSAPQQTGWLRSVLRACEQFLDVQDALRRRQQADQVYRDLQSERISRQQAVEEIRALNKRQKGGWLKLFAAKRSTVASQESVSDDCQTRTGHPESSSAPGS